MTKPSSVHKAKAYFLLLIMTVSVALVGCAATTDRYYSPEQLAKLPRDKVRVIETYASADRKASIKPDAIELHYFPFHEFNAPNAIRDWKDHFVIGPGSVPKWEYVKISKVAVLRADKNDAAALQVIRQFASQHGGDAVVELYRSPVLSKPVPPAAVIAYEYEGVIVMRKAQ